MFKYIVFCTFLACVLFGFYWLHIRPQLIRKSCFDKVRDLVKDFRYNNDDAADMGYRLCIVKEGIKPESLTGN